MTASPHCPVCGGRGRPLLALPAQPIYQHPVQAGLRVPEPHTVDLAWDLCTSCGHGWQPHFDAALLERIYRQHYYTPAPDGIAVQFRDEFLSTLERFGLLRSRVCILEIGASGGDVLAELRGRTGASRAVAFEPDERNAAGARRRGLTVRERFFGADSAADLEEPAGLAYARHVIEHVFDFDDFFAGLARASADDADLVLETPELDHHARTVALNPFHVEHVHVFSRRSLAALARRHGWRLQGAHTSGDGNLIAWFRRAGKEGIRDAELPAAPDIGDLQARYEAHRARMRALLAGRRLVFWGAGSAGARLAQLVGRAPDAWTDGNPAKAGMQFVGQAQAIVEPRVALAAEPAGAPSNAVLVIASSFQREILPRVRALGWTGEVLGLAGERL